MPLKIWGRLTSINVQKAMLCVEELDLPHERIDAGLAFGLVNTPEYRAMNPNGLVPVMKDDDFVLWESNAIVRYLAAKHASGLALADRSSRARRCRSLDGLADDDLSAGDRAGLHASRAPPAGEARPEPRSSRRGK